MERQTSVKYNSFNVQQRTFFLSVSSGFMSSVDVLKPLLEKRENYFLVRDPGVVRVIFIVRCTTSSPSLSHTLLMSLLGWQGRLMCISVMCWRLPPPKMLNLKEGILSKLFWLTLRMWNMLFCGQGLVRKQGWFSTSTTCLLYLVANQGVKQRTHITRTL